MKAAFIIFLLFWPHCAYALSTEALCVKEKNISYPAPGLPPTAKTWGQSDVAAGLVASDCARWLPGDFKLDVALAGSFHYKGDAAGLLIRFGAISTLRGVRYWSVHDGRWLTLITNAFALNGPDSGPQRDFTMAKLENGRNLYFKQSDDRTPGPIVYRMRVETSSPTMLVVRITNITSVHFLFLSVFNPGDLQSVYVLKRLSPGTWSYFNLLGIRDKIGFATGGMGNSWINRSVAIYRHFVGIPTDQNPPLVH
jgi:hypothetical protein